MEKVYAFTDEYGAFGWEIDNPSVSTHFIITAIIVKESDLVDFTQKSEILRKKHFQTGEIKSSKIGKEHSRRLRILADLQDIPFLGYGKRWALRLLLRLSAWLALR